jgi:adenine phosphoribosyltransferase
MTFATGDKLDALKAKIRHVPDFPKAGILFYDVTTLLRDPEGFRVAIDSLSTPYKDNGIDLVVGIESRGFILGAAVADRLGAGFVPVRKVGKLPSTTVKVSYDLEYGSDSLEMHKDAVLPGQRVLIVDDLLATGGTARATVDLVKQLGGIVEGVAVLIELADLNGRAKLQGEKLFALLKY